MNTKDFVVGQITEIPEITGEKCYFCDGIIWSEKINHATIKGTPILDLYIVGDTISDTDYENNEIGYQFKYDGKCYEVSIFIVGDSWDTIDSMMVELYESIGNWHDVFAALSL